MRKAETYKKQKGRCFYCERQFTPAKLTKDHFFPVASVGNGRNGARENIVLACNPCNQKKGARLPRYAEIVKYVMTFGRLPYHLGVYYDGKKSTRKTKVHEPEAG